MARLLEERGRKCGEQRLFASFGLFGKRNRSFENNELSVQRLKFLFMCSLVSWAYLFIEHSSMSIVDFIDWLGSD